MNLVSPRGVKYGATILCISAVLITCSMTQRTMHRFKTLTSQRVKSLMKCSQIESLKQYDFPAILKERVPGTSGHAEVKEYILSRLSQLDASRWNVTEHSFEQNTVIGRKRFTNIIATLDPNTDRRLVLAAHYDSKILTNKVFLGATDSALSVALLLDVALYLNDKLLERQMTDVSLQLIFMDGEEAFVQWSNSDSLYGSRQLAADMNVGGGLLSVNGKTGIAAIEAFILLDLIGSSNPHASFQDHFSDSTNLFQRLHKIEKLLSEQGHLVSHSRAHFASRSSFGLYMIEDDHKPFLDLGVPVVHLITHPFPSVWHKEADNAEAIDWTFVANFRKIMVVFLHEYFHLR